MKIYTKTGDKGETGIIGKRISKSSDLINTIGSLDELNASIGVTISKLQFNKQADFESETLSLLEIQSTIFDIGAILANGKTDRDFQKITKVIEQSIDLIDKDLEPLQNFILPGGSEESALIHLSRAICRRAERNLVGLNQVIEENSQTNLKDQLIFINRLSDYLFILARYTNFKLGYEDIKWHSKN